MKVSIRIMGDKELAYRVAEIIKNTLNNSIEWKEYKVYKDNDRTIVDKKQIRLYAVLEVK